MFPQRKRREEIIKYLHPELKTPKET